MSACKECNADEFKQGCQLETMFFFNCKLFNPFILVIELQHTVNKFVVTVRALYFPIREHKQACGLAEVITECVKYFKKGHFPRGVFRWELL